MLPCSDEVARRYESLRHQAVGHLAPRAELGLFVQRGMAAWINTWGRYTPALLKPIAANPIQGGFSIEADIVMIIAGMALSCITGVEDDS